MDPSALSVTARELRSYLAPKLGLPVDQILIGTPSVAHKLAESETSLHYLNLFFYRIEPGAYPADGDSRDPLYLRVHCLITAFADSDSGTGGVGAGENDLRLLGGVMQQLHAQPFLTLRSNGNPIAQLQVLLNPLSLDDINHLWATQGEIPYRLSVAYELALLPLPLDQRVERSRRVGTLGLEVTTGAPEGIAPVTTLPFSLSRLEVDTRPPDWTPQLAFLGDDGGLQPALSYAKAAAPATVRIVAAGRPGDVLELYWEAWDHNAGWGKPMSANPPTLEIHSSVVDPVDGIGIDPVAVKLPAAGPAQLQLYLRRNWTRPDGVTQTLRSNPVLISLLQAGTP
ncbi:MAG: DUF4255 domain-containing protein [Candidatus Competibacteraceae bacterium]